MHNARNLVVALWLLVPWLVLAQPLPPLTRSVLTTNIPPFGLTGQALFRTTALPYLAWSNIVASGGDTVLSNYVVALSNLLWESDNIVSNYVNSVSNLANGGSGAYIKSLNGNGTNTTFRQSASGNVPVTIIPQIGTTTNRLEVQDTNNNPKFVVDAQGRVGINTNNPQAVLHVRGTNGPSQYIVQVENPMIAATSNAFLVSTGAYTSVGGTLRIDDDANCIIKRMSAGTSMLQAEYGLYMDKTAITDFLMNSATEYGTIQNDTGGTWSLGWRHTLGNAKGTPVLTWITNAVGINTNTPAYTLDVIGENARDIVRFGTSNKTTTARWDTNGNSYLAGTFSPTNGIVNQVSNSFIGNLVIVTNNPQLYCVNGTNQLLTLPDVTKIPVGQVIRFSSTNGYCSYVITNATGAQTIRDGTSLSYSGSGVSSIAFFSDGAAWWIASKAKTIWPNASWSTSTNVPMAVTGSNYISYDTLETSNAQGITLTNGYQIYIRDPGQYMLTYSVVTQVGHNNDTNRVWLQQSGVNVPRSRTDVKIPSTTAQQTITVNYIVPVVTNLTWFALCVRSTDTGSQLVTGAGADATQPAMPSTIVTVNRVSDSFP